MKEIIFIDKRKKNGYSILYDVRKNETYIGIRKKK